MRRKRILGLATIGLVFSLALAGCTGSSKESTASKNTERTKPLHTMHDHRPYTVRRTVSLPSL